MRYSLFLISFLLISCGSVRVTYDYDSDSDFSSYKTYAFSKEQIENLEISDIDKKRILSSVESYLNSKGYNISKHPDLNISIETKAKENVYINRYSNYDYKDWYSPN